MRKPQHGNDFLLLNITLMHQPILLANTKIHLFSNKLKRIRAQISKDAEDAQQNNESESELFKAEAQSLLRIGKVLFRTFMIFRQAQLRSKKLIDFQLRKLYLGTVTRSYSKCLTNLSNCFFKKLDLELLKYLKDEIPLNTIIPTVHIW